MCFLWYEEFVLNSLIFVENPSYYLDLQGSTHHEVLECGSAAAFKCIILLMHAKRNCGAAAFFRSRHLIFLFYYVMWAVSSSLCLTPSKYLAGRLWFFSLFFISFRSSTVIV